MSEDLPEFKGYQMEELMYDGDGFRIYMDKYNDLWLSDDIDYNGYCVSNDILAAIWEELTRDE